MREEETHHTPSPWSTSDHSMPANASTRKPVISSRSRAPLVTDSPPQALALKALKELWELLPLQVGIGLNTLPLLSSALVSPLVHQAGSDLPQSSYCGQRWRRFGGAGFPACLLKGCSLSGLIQLVHHRLPSGSAIRVPVVPRQVHHRRCGTELGDELVLYQAGVFSFALLRYTAVIPVPGITCRLERWTGLPNPSSGQWAVGCSPCSTPAPFPIHPVLPSALSARTHVHKHQVGSPPVSPAELVRCGSDRQRICHHPC